MVKSPIRRPHPSAAPRPSEVSSAIKRQRPAKVGPRTLLAATIVAGGVVATAGANASELPLSRVVLSSIGLAQFTHSGTAAAGTSIEIPVRLDQVDDLLKSLTVFDREGGVGAVSLPGRTPLVELFRDLPFGPQALESPVALLNALVGAELEIAGKVSARGRILRVEPENVQLPDRGGMVTRHRITLMTDRGLVQGVLEEATSVTFTSAEARAQIDRALAGIAENAAKERRKLSLSVLGSGTRPIAVSYVVAAPVWKTSYRLVLPREGGKARLQGWAVVENLTGGDWRDVELTLVSGNPVALRQRLYTAFFADREEIPVTTGQRIVPRRDDADAVPAPVAAASPRAKAAPASPVMAQRALLEREAMARGRDAAASAAMAAPPPELAQMGAPAMAAEADEAATQLLYRFPARVSLATGHTMMVPFVDREITGERTWLYQPETHARRPLAAVRIRNDGETGLPAGIVTAFERAGDGATNFVGDAQVPLLPKGTFKFITFALDTKTDIRREDSGVRTSSLGKVVNGELTITVRSRRQIGYEVTPPVDEDREIVVEERREDRWTAAADQPNVDTTATLFRYRIQAPKGRTTKGSLTLERTDRQIVTLTAMAPEQMLATIRGLENEGPALRSAIARLGTVVSDIAKARSEKSRLDAERQRIRTDQERIRLNLQSAGAGSDLGRRYLDTLRAQEDRLVAIEAREQALDKEMADKRRLAEEIARTLTL